MGPRLPAAEGQPALGPSAERRGWLRPPADGDLLAWLYTDLAGPRPVSTDPAAYLEGARRDLALHPDLRAAPAVRGEPEPEGVARVCVAAGRHPQEFRELVTRAGRAAEDPRRLAELEDAVAAFLANGLLRPGDAGELGYVAARLLDLDRTRPADRRPLFQQPDFAREGAEPPGAPPRGAAGDVDSWFQDGGWPWEGDSAGLGVSDLDERGPGIDWGDGIQGLGDEASGLGSELGAPLGRPPLPPGPDVDLPGGSELPPTGMEGPYGGLDIEVARLGQIAGGKKGKGKGPKQAIVGTVTYLPAAGQQAGKAGKKKGKTSGGRSGEGGKAQDPGGQETVEIYSPTSQKRSFANGDYQFEYVNRSGNLVIWQFDKNDNLTGVITHYRGGGSGGMVGPEGSGSDTPPVHEPQLLVRATQEAEATASDEAGRGGAIDPRPVREAEAPAVGAAPERAASGPSGSQGTEQKWRFAGKKPGSEVTDPAEWQCPGCEGGLAIRYDLSQVTDPPGAAATAAGLAALAEARSVDGRPEALAPIHAALLLRAVQAAGQRAPGAP
jgi:hypothetical protein